jgi:hypothetical protein
MTDEYLKFKEKLKKVSEEIRKNGINTGDLARAEAFPKGNSIVYIKKGVMVKEYPDGRIEPIEGEITEDQEG